MSLLSPAITPRIARAPQLLLSSGTVDIRWVAQIRSRAGAVLRSVLGKHGFVEVETPRLVRNPIPEPDIALFRTEHRGSRGTTPLVLSPSPEVWLKRLLARGAGSVFEIARCYRNSDQQGRLHNSEFTMLEAYGVGWSSMDMLDLTIELCRAVAEGRPGASRFAEPAIVMSVSEAFQNLAGITLELPDPGSGSPEGEQSAAAAARDALDSLRAQVPGLRSETFRDGFHEVLVSAVEPALPPGPVALTEYPALVPALARRSSDGRFRDRWELYVDGIELCNTYAELTDPQELRDLMVAEAGISDPREIPVHPFGAPLPECSGIALGLDRLLMITEGIPSISGVILLPDSAILE